MEDFRKMYLRLCKEGGVEPQESVVAQLQDSTAQSPRLDLSGQSLSADTCSVLARAFQNDIVFTEVLLSDCMLNEEGVLVLTCLFLNINVHEKHKFMVVLEWNAVGVWDEAFSLFCAGLACNSVLTQLDLRNNQINHHGAYELALALKRNNTLEVLDLRWNNIGLLGGRSLLKALQKNKSIVQLEIAGNNIPSDTLKALEQITGHNSDRQSTLRESRSRTQVLSKEIQTLKEEKSRQVTSLMAMTSLLPVCYIRSTYIQIGQLQEALNERKSAVNSLTAKLQMTEAALALSEQKNHNMGQLLTRVRAEKEEQREQHITERNKKQEVWTDGRRENVEEMERRCKSQQQQVFELKQELTNCTAELKLRLAQAEDRLEVEKRRSKQVLEDMDGLRQKEVAHVNQHLEDSERALQERIFKLEGQRIQLEEELSKVKAACVTERAQAEEELGRARVQVRLEEQEHVSSLEEKLRSVRSSLQEVQLHSSHQKQTISDLQAKNTQQSIEMDALRRRIEDLQQELLDKDQEKVADVSRVRVELQEQIGHLQAERTAQGGLKEKISALEREIKVLSSNHREALLDKESEISHLMEKLRLRDAEIQRMKEDEANRASYLQSAILTYIQGSPLGHYSSPMK
uniref:Leucine rich repeat containing 45 n=1 Tax=Mastacembelus armatus TaxID=205130 RepID=A0A7N8YNY9_9TELE